jgi:hypothetical protein
MEQRGRKRAQTFRARCPRKRRKRAKKELPTVAPICASGRMVRRGRRFESARGLLQKRRKSALFYNPRPRGVGTSSRSPTTRSTTGAGAAAVGLQWRSSQFLPACKTSSTTRSWLSHARRMRCSRRAGGADGDSGSRRSSSMCSAAGAAEEKTGDLVTEDLYAARDKPSGECAHFDASERRSEPEGSIKGSIPTACWRACERPQQQSLQPTRPRRLFEAAPSRLVKSWARIRCGRTPGVERR